MKGKEKKERGRKGEEKVWQGWYRKKKKMEKEGGGL
jgi:hypothetical protein